MTTTNENVQGHHSAEHGVPWMHVIGFVISLVLTAIPLWMVLQHLLRPMTMFTIILVLAVLQILVQLFFFMHVRESHGPAWHVIMLGLGFILTITIVAGSMWIMTFGSESY